MNPEFTESYEAASRHAAVFEADWLGVARLTGADRVTWLQGMVTADVEKLKPGESCYAGHLNAQGKVLAQMTILREEDALWLILERSAAGNLTRSFDKLIIMEDVLAEDVSTDFAVLGVVGPEARAVLEKVSGVGRVVPSALGFEVLVPKANASVVLTQLAQSGAVPVGRDVWEVLRIEAGLPVYGVDIDETTTMPELGERGISYDKGCYIGQEVVARVKYIGHVNRRFMAFDVEGIVPPAAKTVIRAAGKDVGYVTSSTFSPSRGCAIALGFVSRVASVPGTVVEFDGLEGSVSGSV